jgi:hypothetical protein
LAVVLALPAPSCPANVLGVLDALSLLLARRASDVSVVVLGVGGITERVAAACPPKATLLAVSRDKFPAELPVPGLPLLVVVSRGGAFARVEWLPPMPVAAEALARDLERYFTLPER